MMHRKIGSLLSTLLLLIGCSEQQSPDAPLYQSIDQFAKKWAKQHQMQFLNSSCGILSNGQNVLWDISLVSRQQLTLEEAREVAKDLTHSFLCKVYHDPLFAQDCQESFRAKGDKELREEYVGFRLAFWDQNMDRPLFPYVAQVRLADGCLFIHYADPQTQALQDPLVEPLEALKLPDYHTCTP